MYLGNVMEFATCDSIFKDQSHPYTQALLSAVPIANPKLERQKKLKLIEGDLPSPLNPPKGCVFSTRCPTVIDKCCHSRPDLEVKANNSLVACFKV